MAPRTPVVATTPANIWYATAADALHHGEPFGHVIEPAGDSALTAIQSGTQRFVADPAAGRR